MINVLIALLLFFVFIVMLLIATAFKIDGFKNWAERGGFAIVCLCGLISLAGALKLAFWPLL